MTKFDDFIIKLKEEIKKPFVVKSILLRKIDKLVEEFKGEK